MTGWARQLLGAVGAVLIAACGAPAAPPSAPGPPAAASTAAATAVPPAPLRLVVNWTAPASITALEAGQIDAGVITQPVPRAVKANYHELIDLSIQGPEYASVAVGGLRGWIQANGEAVRRYVRAHVRADQRAQSDRGLTL